MLRQTNAYLCVFHLERLVSQGQWTEALDYIIPRFLPRVPRSPPSLEARVLVKFLRMQHLFELEVVRHLDEHSLDRRAMWARAAEIVGDLANRTPEFRDRLLLPDGLMGPQHVLPIGFGFAPLRRRRHVKNHVRPARKLARRRHTRRVAKLYFDKRMSLPSCSHSTQELAPEIIAKARDDWFRRIMEECVKAATCPELNQGCACQSRASEGTPATGNVAKPQCSSVPLATDAANRGSSMMRTRAVECGQELRLFVPGEYPCVRRFRYRRLLTFLWLQGYGYTFVAMLKQTNSYFCVFHLAYLVSQGQWTEALDYIIPRFLPRVPRSLPSLEARVLVKFLRMQRLFEWEAVRHLDKFSLDRRTMWARAAEIVQDLAKRTPEFKDRLLLPYGRWVHSMYSQLVSALLLSVGGSTPRNIPVLPASLHVNNIPVGLPSCCHSTQELAPEIIAKARDDWFTRIMEECVKAATCPELNEGCALQSRAREDVAISRITLGTMACPAKNSQIISTPTAGTGREVCVTESARQGLHARKRPAPEQHVDYLARKKQLTAGAHGEANTAQEVCFTESARQGSHPRKRPMTEQMEDYPATKKQLTTGDNGEASVKAQSPSIV